MRFCREQKRVKRLRTRPPAGGGGDDARAILDAVFPLRGYSQIDIQLSRSIVSPCADRSIVNEDKLNTSFVNEPVSNYTLRVRDTRNRSLKTKMYIARQL